MTLLYADDRIVVCLKPCGVVSTDVPGGLPELVRAQLGAGAPGLRTVHRLDQAVGGVMVLACTARAAADLSAQIREGRFEKTYLALCRGTLPPAGAWEDQLHRDKARRITQVAAPGSPEAQFARLQYRPLAAGNGLSLARVELETGRTHQIRVQFASRGFPLVGDWKYGPPDDSPGIGLWCWQLRLFHPRTGAPMTFCAPPPRTLPWTALPLPADPDTP